MQRKNSDGNGSLLKLKENMRKGKFLQNYETYFRLQLDDLQ
jgi:hypothetical protein